jgi:RimJ/RimL family protein N-acetyltransferase
MSIDIPVLETERLVLRGHRREDFPAYARMWADPVVTRYVTGKPCTEEESWARFMRGLGHWALMGYGFWSLHLKDGTRIGEGGFLNVKRDLVPSLEGIPEVGWGLAGEAHGKGYAEEAVRAMLAWGEAKFGKRRFACIISPDNAPSLKLAAKLGFREAVRTVYHDDPIVVLYRDPA